MRRLLVVLTLVLAGCTQDDPRIERPDPAGNTSEQTVT